MSEGVGGDVPTISNNSIPTSGRPYDNMFGHYKYPKLNSGSMQSSFITPASNFLYGKNRPVETDTAATGKQNSSPGGASGALQTKSLISMSNFLFYVASPSLIILSFAAVIIVYLVVVFDTSPVPHNLTNQSLNGNTSENTIHPTYPNNTSEITIHPTYPNNTSEITIHPTYPNNTSEISIHPTYPNNTSEITIHPTYQNNTSEISIHPTYPNNNITSNSTAMPTTFYGHSTIAMVTNDSQMSINFTTESTLQTTITYPSCTSSQYRCPSSIQCVSYTTWCNGVADCPAGTDEPPSCNMFCPSEAVHYCSTTQKCIFQVQRCNRFQDCPDDSDESNCTCDLSYEYACFSGRCIYKQWLCDGVKDCPFGDDESPPHCNVCNDSLEFTCKKGHSCIPYASVCDGVVDCTDSSDESSCFFLTGKFPGSNTTGQVVNATYKGTSGNYICADNWNVSWSDFICRNAGYAQSSSTTEISSNNTNITYLVLNSTTSTYDSIKFFASNVCNSLNVIGIACLSSNCGQRSTSLNNFGPYIINGERALSGAFPWHAYIMLGYVPAPFHYVCGGSLINNRWIATATHCLNDARALGLNYSGVVQPSNVLISLGYVTMTVPVAGSWRGLADRVIINSNYDTGGHTNDVALIRLQHTVTFNSVIQAICLPDTNVNLNKFKVCVDTGYGLTLRSGTSDTPAYPPLLQAKMNIIPYSSCHSYMPSLAVQDATQMCIGTLPTIGDINICSGDSGGPLSCQDQQNRWSLIGINSYVSGYTGATDPGHQCILSVATRVSAMVNWIDTNIAANP